jgi:cytochrome c556
MTIRTKAAFGVAAACAAALLATVSTAQDQKALERAVKARQGLMNVHVLEAGPLIGMAKGEVPYDPAVASGHAEALSSLTGYDETRMFPAGTSNAEMPGKTLALPAIWEQPDEFQQAFENLREAAETVATEAGNGQEQLTAAVGELGKACGNCHEKFREKQ